MSRAVAIEWSKRLANGDEIVVKIKVSGEPVHGEGELVLDAGHQLLRDIERLRAEDAK